MPRIRTIKPEFWDSPDTRRASPWARLAYIAMWNWADDFGRGTANLKELEGFIFPNDTFPVRSSGNTVHFRDVVAEVSECYDVLFYEVDGRPYYLIPAWEKHQRNERRAKQSKYPDPPENVLLTRGTAGSSGNTVHVPDAATEAPRSSGAGTGEQGNRGTGEQTSTSADADALFAEFWDAFGHKFGKQRARTNWDKVVKRDDPQVVIAGARRYAAHVAAETARDPRFKPKWAEGWLSERRWEDELSTVDQAPEQRGSFIAPQFNDDWPREYYVRWNKAHFLAYQQGKPGPSDWHELQVAS